MSKSERFIRQHGLWEIYDDWFLGSLEGWELAEIAHEIGHSAKSLHAVFVAAMREGV